METNYKQSLKTYITKEEEKELMAKIKKGDKEARDKFIMNYYPYVRRLAVKYVNYGFEFEDLVHYGIEGLIHAIDKYTEEKETRFITYATSWILQYMRRNIENNSRIIRIPVYKQEKAAIYWDKLHEVEQENGETPSVLDMSNILNISYQDSCDLYTTNGRTNSIDVNIFGDEIDQVKDFIPGDSYLPHEEIIKKSLRKDIIKLINTSKLTKKQMRIIELRYGLNGNMEHSYTEIAKMIGTIPEAVRMMHWRALNKMRSNKNINDYIIYLDNADLALSRMEFISNYHGYRNVGVFNNKAYSSSNMFLTYIPLEVKEMISKYPAKYKMLVMLLNGWLDKRIYPTREIQKVLGISEEELKLLWNKYIDDYARVRRIK